jgi:hypothetical protein
VAVGAGERELHWATVLIDASRLPPPASDRLPADRGQRQHERELLRDCGGLWQPERTPLLHAPVSRLVESRMRLLQVTKYSARPGNFASAID